MTRITDLTEKTTLTGAEFAELSSLSTTVTITATTISALASDNSYNDSGSGFVAAGFAIGDRVNVTGFTGDVANNIFAATVTAVTAGKLTIGGTDGDVIVDDAAGESVTITKWESRRAAVSAVRTQSVTTTKLTPSAVSSFTHTLSAGCIKVELVGKLTVTATSGSINGRLVKQSDGTNASMAGVQLYGTRNGSTIDGGNRTADTFFTSQGNDTGAASKHGISATIHNPRSTTQESWSTSRIISTGTATGASSLQIWEMFANTAEDHDEIKFDVSTGTFSGTMFIKETIQS